MKLRIISFLALASAALFACEKQEEPQTVSVSGITFTQTEYSVNTGGNLAMASLVSVSPDNATNKTLTWSSSDASVASVDASTGNVQGVKAGEATITAAATDGSGVKNSVKITVKDFVPVSSVNIKDVYFIVSVGEEYNLAGQTEVLPANATNKELQWSSSDPSKATVDENGVIKGLKTGAVVITAKSKDGSAIEATREIHVRYYGTKYDLAACNDFTDLQTQADYVMETADFLTGTGCHKTLNAGKNNKGEDVVILHQRTTPEKAINAKGVTLQNGVVVLHLYIGNAKIMEYTSGSFQITSSGQCDKEQLGWSLKQLGEYANGNTGTALATFKDGWNVVEIPFSKATKTGNINLSNINYYRMFNVASSVLYGMEFRVDRIYITSQK